MPTIDPDRYSFKPGLGDVVLRAQRASPFLRRLIDVYPTLVETLAAKGVDAALAQARASSSGDCMRRLRIARGRIFLVLALADLNNSLSFERIVSALTDFADEALDLAIADAIANHVGGAQSTGFAAIALGKHGSRELNYSSDIDPIFIYDPATLPRRPREEPAEAAVRIARRVVDVMQARTGDGFVFRVDLRLRPASEATPIALPIEAAIGHYESSALTWERAAFIRARAAAGDIALGERFLGAISPFVWRRSLDFGAVADLRALTHSIRQTHGQCPFGPGYDVKRGRGGIREVEFYAQIHQLIHGGRDSSLRAGATLDALDSLAGAGWVSHDIAKDLGIAYVTLRTVEHRLQLIDDRQTHVLPPEGEALDAVARLDGLKDGTALLKKLSPRVAMVAAYYDALDPERGSVEPDDLTAGFAEPMQALARINRWRGGGVRVIRSPAAIAAFEAVLPDLIHDLAAAPDPDAALARLDAVLEKLSSGVNLFRLLDAQPVLRQLLVDILSHAPTLADALAVRPALFDRLVDRTALDPAPDVAALVAEMAGRASPIEIMLDHVRRIVGEYQFALGTQIVAAAADPLSVAGDYAHVAEAAVEVIAGSVIADFKRVHGRVPESEFAILALGRLGGGLLTHASDLDLIYLFTGDYRAESDGSKPLGATQYFNRLGSRVTAALSVPTAAGALYDIDTRLRPSGTQGPLVASTDSFDRYQREAAWTWERMALTRARPIFGSEAARAEIGDIVSHALNKRVGLRALARDVVAMRANVAVHKPSRGAYDVKLGTGGLVDLEFTVQFHQLATGTGLDPDLRIALVGLTRAGVLGSGFCEAHDLLTRLLVTLRIVAPDLGEPIAASRALVARSCGLSDWPSLVAEIDSARQCVTRAWAQIVEIAGE